MIPLEVQLLQEIAGLRQVHEAVTDEAKKQEILKKIREKQLEFKLMVERQKRGSKK